MDYKALLSTPAEERLELGLAIFTPVAAIPGSASFFFLQPLFRGKIFSAAGIVIGFELFLFIANRLFQLENVQVRDLTNNGQLIQMPISELQELLAMVTLTGAHTQLTGNSANSAPSSSQQAASSSNADSGFLTPETRGAPLVIGLAVASDYSNSPFAPGVFFLLPILTLSGVNGALPMLILETLVTIFVRAVAPPQATGTKPPVPPTTPRPLQFKPEDLLQFLTKFGKHFGKEQVR